VLWASLPLFVNTIAYGLGGKLDVTMLGWIVPSGSPEVGWYTAAQSLAGLAMLLAPLLSSVLMPLMTRAQGRSEEEFFFLVRRSLEGVLLVAIPVTMMIALGADVWVPLLFRAGYGPSIPILKVLAPSFVLTYGAVLLANALLILGRSWTVTLVSLGSLAIQPVLILLAVPFGVRHLGVGGAGLANAFVFSFLELFSVVGFWVSLGRRAVDRRCALAIGKSLAAFAAIAALNGALALRGLWGPFRLVIDAASYAALLVASRTVRLGEVALVVRDLVARRRGRGSPG
jgi:O-antigen/teichoic acid export membrane protein